MNTGSASLPTLPDDERILLLLGLLTSQDRHGYEINDFIEHQLNCVIDLKKATAYQLLERLEQHELIHGRIEPQDMKPSRKVYALTPAGHAHFLKLLSTQLRHEEALILPGNVPIMFCEHLSVPEQLSALQERTHKLSERLKVHDMLLGLPQLTSGVRLATERIQALTQADLHWTGRLVERLSLENKLENA